MPLQMKRETRKKWLGICLHRDIQQKIPISQVSANGKIVFSSMHEIRNFIHEFNAQLIPAESSGTPATAAEWNGVLLLNEIFQKVMHAYQETINKSVFSQAEKFLERAFSKRELNTLFQKLIKDFSLSKTITKDSAAIQELILLWLLNDNNAFKKYRVLFDDTDFYFETTYLESMEKLNDFFENQPLFGKEKLSLLKLLRKPAEMSPDSILGQLEYIRNNWQEILGDDFFDLLTSIDSLKEEQTFAFTGKAPSQKYDFSLMEEEPEQFSEDLDWMPKVVMLAKSTYVWLDQLSKKYKGEIHHLDQIPDEELYHLHKQGFTTLWLIGLWERSKASKRIKHINGSTDAIASAYSIYEYRIADDLGGEAAFWNLKERCWRFHIRLASDMVPNHTGIDSKWMKEHPDWFLQLPYSPYPNYSFNGENLSHDDEYVVQIEDHYYNKSDAAVVFHYYDKRDGSRRYIYHGNDGTSFPWNDTAQLNYLLPQVREAVIRQIIEVAHKTPVIRFDAAMTLAKRHYQRLWFPEPGSGGDIPTRAEFGLTKEEFNHLFPVEFWREVVDRIAIEAPDTLLLAEAFWMMEGYFVRTLGMHRVYNSAFMNMLKDEENAKYRNSLFNIIGFNVEILKRFVNFMSNPDEETTVAQFGKGDKYFGVCVLMSTMPGLPMFAHGQIEGFTERYGMEYNRAKWNEFPDEELVSRHEREIFPILKRRAVFSDAENFLLYDFQDEQGNINDNVFGYSNQKYGQSSLVLYHNKFETASGWIKIANTVEHGKWRKKTIAEAISIPNDENVYVIFQDLICKKWFVRNAKEIFEKGLFEILDAYKYKVYVDFYQVQDTEDKAYEKLASYLQGGGTKDVNNALRKTYLIPLLNTFRKIVNEQTIAKLIKLQSVKTKEYELYLTDFLQTDLLNFYQQVADFNDYTADLEAITKDVVSDLQTWYEMQPKFQKKYSISTEQNVLIILWLLLRKLDELDKEKSASDLLNELMIFDELQLIFKEFPEIADWLNLLFDNCSLWQKKKFTNQDEKEFFSNPVIQYLLQINEFNKIKWYHAESMRDLIFILQVINYLHYMLSKNRNQYDWRRFGRWLRKWQKAHSQAECKIESFLEILGKSSQKIKQKGGK